MLTVLAIILAVMTIVIYLATNYDIISPSFVLCGLFLFSTLFAIAGNTTWGVNVSGQAVFAIIIGVLSVHIGEMLGRRATRTTRLYQGSVRNAQPYANSDSIIRLPFYRLLIVIAASAVLLFLYRKRIVTIATSVGYSGEMLQAYYRRASVISDIDTGIFFALGMGMLSASSYICIYVLINNFVQRKSHAPKTFYWLHLVPVFLHVVSMILSSSRNGFITLFAYIAVIFAMKYRQRIKRINIVKAVVVGSLGIGIFLVIFTNLGRLTGKTQDENIISNILIYVGSSIVALSSWLNTGARSRIFGQESFAGLRYTLQKFFPSMQYESKFLEFTNFADGSSTNIYTGFRSYIADFGWVGMILMCIAIGLILTVWYRKTIKKGRPLSTILYGYFFGNFIYLLFTPLLTSTLFSSSQVSEVMWTIVLYAFLLKKERSSPEHNMRRGD